MNTNLLYAKASYMGFVNNDEWMNDSITSFANTQTMSKDDVFAMANQCRKNGYTPVFADDSKFLATSAVSGDAGAVVVTTSTPLAVSSVTPVTKPQSTQSLPNQVSQLTSNLSQKDKNILEGIGIGLGVLVLFKMLA